MTLFDSRKETQEVSFFGGRLAGWLRALRRPPWCIGIERGGGGGARAAGRQICAWEWKVKGKGE